MIDTDKILYAELIQCSRELTKVLKQFQLKQKTIPILHDDAFNGFIIDKCTLDWNAISLFKDLFTAYKQYCLTYEYYPVTAKRFSMLLNSAEIRSIKLNGNAFGFVFFL